MVGSSLLEGVTTLTSRRRTHGTSISRQPEREPEAVEQQQEGRLGAEHMRSLAGAALPPRVRPVTGE